MIDYETYVQIRNYFTRDHLRYSQIANKLGLDQRTVAIWANEKKYRTRKSAQRKSKLDPFKNHIVQMLEKHSYTAQQIYQRIKEDGFEGRITIVEDYVRKVRPPKIKAYLNNPRNLSKRKNFVRNNFSWHLRISTQHPPRAVVSGHPA